MRLRILIWVYVSLPILAFLLMAYQHSLFQEPGFQDSLGSGMVVAVLILLFGHMPGTHWLLTRRLKELRLFCGRIRTGEYDPVPLPNEPPDESEEHELTALIRHMNWMANRIRVREGELTCAVDTLRTTNENLDKARAALWGEMELAKKIQTALLPASPHIPGYAISAFMEPADEVGGDYYDVIATPSCHWLLIGDVSGHGVTSGLIQMMARTAIHSIVEGNPGLSPAELLDRVNGRLTEDIQMLEGDQYMTMTALRLDPDGKLVYAGMHQPLLLHRRQTDSVEEVESRGMWLALMPDIEDMLPVDELRLAPGDTLLLHTDGITEAVGPDGEMWEMEGLMDTMAANAGEEVSVIAERVRQSLEGYTRDDDRTALIIRRHANGI